MGMTLRIGDKTVNRLGFGAMRITGEGIWGPPNDHDTAIQVLKRAVELGANFIDTADAYGPEVSENLIREALYPYDGLVIATKGGMLRGGPGVWTSDGSPKHLREACDASLKRLGVDQIELYQFHRPDPAVSFTESVKTFVDLQLQGKIAHIGLSNVSAAQLEKALELATIVSVQNSYSVLNRTSEDVLKLCEQRGIAFIPYFPIGKRRRLKRTGTRKHCRKSRCNVQADRSRVAAATQPGHVTHSRYGQPETSGRKHESRRH